MIGPALTPEDGVPPLQPAIVTPITAMHTTLHKPVFANDFDLCDPSSKRFSFEGRVPVNSDAMAEDFLLLSVQNGGA